MYKNAKSTNIYSLENKIYTKKNIEILKNGSLLP